MSYNTWRLKHESVRGSQYTCQALLKQHGITYTRNREENCWDNASMTRFFSSLSRDLTGDRIYRIWQEMLTDVQEYVAMCLSTTLPGYKTLMEYENIPGEAI
jgi:hypothetical protein